MAPVEIMLRTILCAVPAFMRDDPANTSGPTSVTMAKSAARSRGELRLQVRAMVLAPRRRAYSRAAMVKGVRPLVAMPRTISCLPGLRFLISREGESGVVFAGFSGGAQRFGASGHDELHGAGIGVEGGRDFRGVESAETAAGAGADVDEASAMTEARGDHVNGTGDLRQCAADCGGNGRVFVIDHADDFERRHLVEIAGRGRNLFGGKVTKILFGGAGCGQVCTFRLLGCGDWSPEFPLLANAARSGAPLIARSF